MSALLVVLFACGKATDSITTIGSDAALSHMEAGTSMPPDAAEMDGSASGGRHSDAGSPVLSDAASIPAAAPLSVTVAGGELRGKLEYGARLFLQIPYGAPPVGDQRFAPAQPAAPWNGVRDATAHGPSCIQPPDGTDGPTAEDCLTLDIYAPLESPDATPVMVFLYGGAFAGGGSHTFASQWLSAPNDVIVVTLNYRLGALGFLADPALDDALGMPSGNLGLRDQQLALRGVRDNIAAFGGDPNRITLFGQSAGAISTCLHLFAPESAELVQHFIMQSGACLEAADSPLTRAQIFQRSESYIKERCPDASQTLTCLRSLPAASLTAASIGVDFLVSGFFPYVDGDFLPAHPRELLRQDRFAGGPMIVGTNYEEYALSKMKGSIIPPVPSVLAMMAILTATYPEDVAALLKLYTPDSDAEANDAFVRLAVDRDFRCPSRALVRGAFEHARAAYLYSFEVLPAVHSMELDYVFGWPSGGVSPGVEGAPYPVIPSVVRAVQGYWTGFARSGVPGAVAGVAWPAYDETAPHLVLAEPTRAAHQLSARECDFWDDYYRRHP